jgi:hypothetical protein
LSDRVLTQRELNRALLARQLLLERVRLPLPRVVERIGGIQNQYAPSGYIALWARVEGFERRDLTRALERRRLVQGTLIRSTIHIVSRRDYWPWAEAIREPQREWRRRTWPQQAALRDAANEALRAALRDGPRHRGELVELLGKDAFQAADQESVRVPPSGTWDNRRAHLFAAAEDWVGPNDSTEEQGLEHLLRAYLRAFGPASWKDAASWAGVSVADIRRGAAGLELTTYGDDRGRELVDLAGAEQPSADAEAPVRFLPHWDANLLVHARRTGVLPEEHRPRVFSTKNPFSVGVYLVDGRAAGAWSLVDSRIVLDPFEVIAKADQRAVERERAALEAFHG